MQDWADRDRVLRRWAGAISGVLHLLLLAGLVYGLIRSQRNLDTLSPGPKPEQEESVILIPAELFDTRYVRTSETAEPAAPHANSPFYSDRDTVAASEAAPDPAASAPIPSQEGTDRKTLELRDRELAEGEEPMDDAPDGARPTPAQPQPALSETPPAPPQPQNTPPEGTELPDPNEATEAPQTEEQPPEENLLAQANSGLPDVPILPPAEQDTPPAKPTPAQPPTPQSQPIPPVPPGTDSFTPQTRRNLVRGTLSNRGANSVDAVATPLGKYRKVVNTAIERRWHLYRRQHLDFATFGNLRLKFQIQPDGAVKELTILSKDANAVMADFTLRAIRDAEIPAMPGDVYNDLGGDPLDFVYDVLIY